MQDIFGMWSDRKNFPKLAGITDDNGDGLVEINRPSEIDAAVTSMMLYLAKKGKLKNRQVVFVKGAEVYRSAKDRILIQAKGYEYSPYGSTFKLSHDIAPAGAALGAGGCRDCHREDSPFFMRPSMKELFNMEGMPLFVPNYHMLNYDDEEIENLLEER